MPAFVGLGAPYWDADARGAIFGLTRGTTRSELARAALEASAIRPATCSRRCTADWPGGGAQRAARRRRHGRLRLTMQFLADILGPGRSARVLETTALGAAYLAGLGGGLLQQPAQFSAQWRLERRFAPEMSESEREAKCGGATPWRGR